MIHDSSERPTKQAAKTASGIAALATAGESAPRNQERSVSSEKTQGIRAMPVTAPTAIERRLSYIALNAAAWGRTPVCSSKPIRIKMTPAFPGTYFPKCPQK
jgi:hypothetical protein